VPWATTHGFRYVELRYLTEGGARIHKRSRPHFVVEESEKGNGDCAKNSSGQAALRMTDPTVWTRRDSSYARHTRGVQVRELSFRISLRLCKTIVCQDRFRPIWDIQDDTRLTTERFVQHPLERGADWQRELRRDQWSRCAQHTQATTQENLLNSPHVHRRTKTQRWSDLPRQATDNRLRLTGGHGS
jgi:hypothetical protein